MADLMLMITLNFLGFSVLVEDMLGKIDARIGIIEPA
jgi:hypothetical protein